MGRDPHDVKRIGPHHKMRREQARNFGWVSDSSPVRSGFRLES